MLDIAKLIFNSTNHTYTYDDKPLPSVTTLLTTVGINTEIPDAIKDSDAFFVATEYGTLVHEQIKETVDNGEYKYKGLKKALPTKDLKFFIKNILPLSDKWYSETMLCTEYYAGTCDLFGMSKEKPDTLLVVDHKTGTAWNENGVSWQTYLYYRGLQECGLLPQHKSVEFYVDDLKGENSKLIKLIPPTEDDYNRLIDSLKNGTKYELATMNLPYDLQQQAKDVLANFATYKFLEKQYKDFTKKLKEACENHGVKEVKWLAYNEEGQLKEYRGYFTKETIREEFNESDFKKDYPELARKYSIEKAYSQFRTGWVKEK